MSNLLFDAGVKADVLGRVAGWSGFDTTIAIPVGSRVRIHRGSYCSGCASRYYVGQEAIVVSQPRVSDRTTGPEVAVRFKTIHNEWDTLDNGRRFRPSCLEVLEVGCGTAVPGVSYPLAQVEILRQRFAALDKTFQEYTNYPTFQAHMYLSQTQAHVRNIGCLRNKDGKVSRKRLARYFCQQRNIQIPKEDHYPDGFPERLDFHLPIDWEDVANEFDKHFAEQLMHA